MRTCLSSIIDQSNFEEWEAVVTDNSDDPMCRAKIELLCRMDPRIRYEWTHDRSFVNFPRVSIPSLYDAAEIGVKMTTGEQLVFPNCDSYYCKVFAERMLQSVDIFGADLNYCDFVQGRHDQPYSYFYTRPEACSLDKTCYMIKREWFPEEWPGKVEQYGVSDGILINELVAKGINHRRVEQVFVVHN
jgi:hypothetical protein